MPVTRNAVDGAHRKTVIATEKYRDRAGLREFVSPSARNLCPRLYFAVIFCIRRRIIVSLRLFADRDIAMILYLEPKAFQQWAKARRSERCRPHQSSRLRRAHFNRYAQQCDAFNRIAVDWIDHLQISHTFSI